MDCGVTYRPANAIPLFSAILEYQEGFVAFFTGPILGPIFITTIMTIISKPLNLGVLGALLHFGEVPDFLRQLLTQKNLVHAFAGALVSACYIKSTTLC